MRKSPYNELNDAIKNNDLPNVLLLFGKEKLLLDWAINEIKKSIISEAATNFDYQVFEGEKLDMNSLIESCETLPMLSDRRLVVLKDLSESDEEELLKYTENFPDSCILLIVNENIDKRKKFFKRTKSYELTTLTEPELKSFITNRLKKHELTAKSTIINKWIRYSGYLDANSDYTLYDFDSDIEKVANYASAEELTWEDIFEVVGTNLESHIFTLLDAVSAGKSSDALLILDSLLSHGENEYKVIHMLNSQLEIMLAVKEMQEDGLTSKQMADLIKVHPFRIKKAVDLATGSDINALKKRFLDSCMIDKKIKTGLVPARLALEMLVTGCN